MSQTQFQSAVSKCFGNRGNRVLNFQQLIQLISNSPQTNFLIFPKVLFGGASSISLDQAFQLFSNNNIYFFEVSDVLQNFLHSSNFKYHSITLKQAHQLTPSTTKLIL